MDWIVLAITVGIIIAVCGIVTLIKGANSNLKSFTSKKRNNEIRDPKGLALWLGVNFTIIGLLAITFALVVYSTDKQQITWVLTGIGILTSLTIVTGYTRYSK